MCVCVFVCVCKNMLLHVQHVSKCIKHTTNVYSSVCRCFASTVCDSDMQSIGIYDICNVYVCMYMWQIIKRLYIYDIAHIVLNELAFQCVVLCAIRDSRRRNIWIWKPKTKHKSIEQVVLFDCFLHTETTTTTMYCESVTTILFSRYSHFS